MEKNIKFYITERDKQYIKQYCNQQIKQKDLIRVKAIVCMLDEKYATYEVLRYVKEELKINTDKIWRGENIEYLYQLKRGHWQLTSDLYFDNCYLHQYIISKELNVDMKEVRKYVIHHIDQNKSNNDIKNLFIFYDSASHIAFHQAIKHNKNIDMEELNSEYIDSILSYGNVKKINKYLKIANKLKNIKKEALVRQY